MTSEAPQPVIPNYAGACISNLVPELIKQVMGAPTADWMPQNLKSAKQIVLLVLDGLGWNQFQSHSQMLPTLDGFEKSPITAVAPSSTPTGLTSIVTSRPPAVHGILGYRLMTDDNDVLDIIGWKVNDKNADELVNPRLFQTQPAFAANDVTAVIEKRHFGHGFTRMMLQDAPLEGYVTPSGLPIEIWRRTQAQEPFIYAYYGGIDTVAHAHGLGEYYDAELYTVDRLVRDIVAGLPSGCALVITSDHGQVQVGNRNLDIDKHIVDMCTNFSGEGRFRWLHTTPDKVEALAAACREICDGLAWVMTKQEISDAGWYGGPIPEKFWNRLGDVALIPYAPIAFKDPSHGGERNMITRHGSLTADEILVPLLSKVVE